MAVRPCARTAHFFAHHCPPPAPAAGADGKLSTASVVSDVSVVDEAVDTVPAAAHLLLGMIVPKRHAKRSVTRSLVKRQLRAGVRRHAHLMAEGDWVVRLRAPLDRKLFVSAASDALRALVAAEVAQLMAEAVRRRPRGMAVPRQG